MRLGFPSTWTKKATISQLARHSTATPAVRVQDTFASTSMPRVGLSWAMASMDQMRMTT